MADSKKLIVKLVCLGAITGLILWVMGHAVIDSRNSITWNTMRDLYAQERIDLAFLGSSTVYESCVLEAFDKALGVNAFNAATPAQTLRESYYQLKEICRLYKPERVLLGLSPKHLIDPAGRDSLSANYLFDNMRWSIVKAEFLADAFDPDHYPSALFPIVRLRAELTAEDMKAAWNRPLLRDEDGPAQIMEGGRLRYEGKGYVANLEVIEEGTLPEAPPLGFSGPGSVAPGSLDWLTKIIRFCDENDMELTFFQTPLLPGATEWAGDYAAYHDFIADYAESACVGFLDFNYLKPEHITYEDDMFSDLEHVTEAFAPRFSGTFAKRLAEDDLGGTSAASPFFTDYDTYRGLYDAVASTWITKVSEGGASVASIGTATPEYRITVLKGEEMGVVYATDWQTDGEAVFPGLEPGDYIVTVEARPVGDEDATPKGNWEELHVR
jgi:hypothetical protein